MRGELPITAREHETPAANAKPRQPKRRRHRPDAVRPWFMGVLFRVFSVFRGSLRSTPRAPQLSIFSKSLPFLYCFPKIPPLPFISAPYHPYFSHFGSRTPASNDCLPAICKRCGEKMQKFQFWRRNPTLPHKTPRKYSEVLNSTLCSREERFGRANCLWPRLAPA
jgi:hypothetical protein